MTTNDEWFLIREEPYKWVENLTTKNIMDKDYLNELASNKVGSKLQVLLREDMEKYVNWGISSDTVKDMIESHKREVKVWSYIFQLIEQDNK